ncbi:MAG: phage baseplate assembly protein [Magnetovibrionaceae bacterium]
MADPANQVTLHVGGRIWRGWTGVTVSRSIQQISGSFEISMTDKDTGLQDVPVVAEGQDCELRIGGDLVIKGYVDDIDIEYDDHETAITIVGRDRTGDVVDCSAVYAGGEWKNAKLEQICADLCAENRIDVYADVDTGARFTTARIQESETKFEMIERLCRLRAVLPVSDPARGLVLTRTGTGRTETGLVLGQNIKKGKIHKSMKGRFSVYRFKGQQQGQDGWDGEAMASPMAEAYDPGVPRHRVSVQLAKDQADNAALQTLAEWQATVNRGRARPHTYTVAGWRQRPGGELWEPNLICPVDDTKARTRADLLITDTTLTIDEDSGSVALLTLMPPEAFAPRPLSESIQDEGDWL